MRITRIVVYLIVGVVLTGFISLYEYLSEDLESQTLQATEEAMVDKAHLLSAILENEIEDGKIDPTSLAEAFTQAKTHKFNAKIFAKVKQYIGTNFYVCDAEGVVIYDSGDEKNIGQNFYRYNDVWKTLEGSYGARSTRMKEDQDDSSVMFTGAPIKHDEQIIGVVSLYKPQANVISFIEYRRRWIISSLVLIGFGICAFTCAVFVWLFQPLGKLTNYARMISEGGRPTFPKLGKGREVNTLGKALHDMRESIEGREYLENYVQMLTHELKSPLSAIRGAAELMDEDMDRSHRQKFLSNIRVETQRSQQIIDGLLRLSQLESLKQLDTQELLDIEEMIEEVIHDQSLLAEQASIKLNAKSSSFHTVHGDRMSLTMALSNVLQNAIQFSEADTEITIQSRETSSHILIEVIDQGVGVPDYAIDKVFENFYSIARPGTNKKSSGLGLAFVREVANLHHGYAKIENNTDRGATTTLAIQK